MAGGGGAARERMVSAAVVVALAGAAIAMALPWLPSEPRGGAILDRYAPLADGAARLAAVRTGGRPDGWESDNTALLPALGAMTSLPPGLQEVLRSLVTRPGEEPAAAEVVRRLSTTPVTAVRTTSLESPQAAAGAARTTVLLRDNTGVRLVGTHRAGAGTEIAYAPPPRLLPADPRPGLTWSDHGTVAGRDFTLEGRVTGQGPWTGPVGTLPDCLTVRTMLAVAGPGGTTRPRRAEQVHCAGVGLVDERTSPPGGPSVRREAVSVDGRVDASALPPPHPLAGLPAAARGSWGLRRLGRADPLRGAARSAVAPVFAGGDPAQLLAAAEDGDLVALSAADGAVRWRVHTSGTVYGTPAVDPARGRVYVGATDRRLYAIDLRGLVLWTYRTGDSVPGRAAVSGGVVVCGSEDGIAYGLDAATGRVRWRTGAGAPIASGATEVAPGLVAVAADDGSVRALEAAGGRARWTARVAGAAEAPVAAAEGLALVASRDGTLTALRTADGGVVWAHHLGEAVLRTAPAVAGDVVVVVDEEGRASALSLDDGALRWSVGGQALVGPPAVVDGQVVLAARGGGLLRVSRRGEVTGRWRGPAAGAGAGAAVTVGPSAGGGAAWLGDADGAVWRLGPPGAPPPVPARWLLGPDALGGRLVGATAAAWRDRAVVLGARGEVMLVEAATGGLAAAGALPAPAPTGAVVSGDVLLAATGGVLHALDLPSGHTRWTARGEARALQPPVTTGEDVLWLTSRPGTGIAAEGRLDVRDVASGRRRWTGSARSAVASAPAVGLGVVVAGSPPEGRDIRDGRLLWRTRLDGLMVGGAAADTTRGLALVGLASGDGRHGAVAAIGLLDGRVRWRTSTGRPPSAVAALGVTDGTVVALLGDPDEMVGIDAASGAVRWRHPVEPPAVGAPLVEGGRVWLIRQDSRVEMRDARSGDVAGVFAGADRDLGAFGLTLQRPARVDGTVVAPLDVALAGLGVTP